MNPLLKEINEGKLTAPITEAFNVLAKGAEAETDALELSVLFRQAEAALSEIRSKLVPAANMVFSNSSDDGALKVRGAKVQRYAPRGRWEFPPDIVKLAEQLKTKQDTAKIDGTAKKQVPLVDPEKQALFAIYV